MTEAREACVHYWFIESPNGETSKGTCKKCGAERDYYNTPDYMREGQSGNQWMKENQNSWQNKKGLGRDKGAI